MGVILWFIGAFFAFALLFDVLILSIICIQYWYDRYKGIKMTVQKKKKLQSFSL